MFFFHKAAVDIVWLGSLPTRTPGGTVTICGLEGYYPTLISPVPSYITHPVPALKKLQNEVNWSLVEHGLQVTKHLKHPHLGNKGDMAWGCPWDSTPGSG